MGTFYLWILSAPQGEILQAMLKLKAMRNELPDWPLWTLPAAFLMITAGTLFATILLDLMIKAVASVAGAHVSLKSPGVILGSTLVQDAAFIGGTIATVWLATKRAKASDFGIVGVAHKWRAAFMALGAWLLFLAVTATWQNLVNSHEKQSITKDLGVDQSTLLWAGSAFLLTVAAPIAEEFVFRGFVFPLVWKKLGLIAGILSSSALFGLLHIGSSPPVLLLPLAFLGVTLCLMRLGTGSLIPCFALHSVNNSVAFGVMEKMPATHVLELVAVGLAATLTIGSIIVRRA